MNKLIELKNAIKCDILFRSEDGVDIYEGDEYFETINDEKIFSTVADKRVYLTGKNSRHHFSTKEAAEEYILMNKPCLSINDFCLSHGGKALQGYEHLEELKELVKSKL